MRNKNKILIHYSKDYLSNLKFKSWLEAFERILKLSLIQIGNVESFVEVRIGDYALEADDIINTVYIPIIFYTEEQNDTSILNIHQNLESIVGNDKFGVYGFIDEKLEKSNWEILSNFDRYYKFTTEHFKFKGKNLKNESLLDESVWLNIIDLVYDLKSNKIRFEESYKDFGVYLSYVSPDISNEREKLFRELKHYSFNVFPKKKILTNKNLLIDEFTQELVQVKVFIQMIGNEYLPIMESDKISQLEFIENLYFEETKSKKLDIKRLIWLTPNFKPKNDKQKKFVEKIIHNTENGENTEIIQCPIEGFKTIVLSRLNEFSNQNNNVNKETENDSVYLIHASEESEELKLIKDEFNSKGLTVLDSVGEKAEIQVDKHKDYLLTCNCVVVLYNFNNEAWLRSKMLDIIKVVGFGRKKPFKCISILARDSFSKSLTSKYNNVDFYFYKETIDQPIVQNLIKKIQS